MITRVKHVCRVGVPGKAHVGEYEGRFVFPIISWLFHIYRWGFYFFGWFLWFRKPGQPHVEQAEEDEGGNGHLLKDNVKNGKAEAKNLPVGRV